MVKFYPVPSPRSHTTHFFMPLTYLHVPDARFLDLKIGLMMNLHCEPRDPSSSHPRHPNRPRIHFVQYQRAICIKLPTQKNRGPSSVEPVSVAKNKTKDLVHTGQDP